MTVLLVIATFVTFILLDHLTARRGADERRSRVAPPLTEPAFPPEPVWVAGFQLPEGLHYHRGHTWARVLDGETVTVGMDDFARRLVGPARAVRLPAVGTWLRQGEMGFRVDTDGRSAGLIAPVEGEVIAVNDDLRAHPQFATEDPYGRGWVLKVRSAGLTSSMRSLFSGSLARRWMEDARAGLDLRLMALSGSVLQDGGEPVPDYAQHVPADEWKRLVGEFLLS